MSFLLVAIGGFFGSMLRFHLSAKANIPLLGTWAANVTGSFLLAFLLSLHLSENLDEWLWFLLGIGFCGAYTTFSTFGNETLELIIAKKHKAAASYVGSSLTVSLVLVIFVLYLS